MNTTAKEVIEFVKENDVKFIRLAFCDLFGRQKNISIMPDELPLAFENGISFDAHAIRGFTDISKSDLFLFPDPTTLSVLPWRPQQGRVLRFYCDIKNPDGTTFWGDTRGFLKSIITKAEEKGYFCKIGSECEFYLFKTDEQGEPTNIPLDQGGYLDVAPVDKGENVRREICLCLEEMGLKPETSHHEQGPGQNEIDFKFSDALSSADNLLTFKTVVKTLADQRGLFASFAPKPLKGKSGSGLHINLSLAKNGFNVFNSRNVEHSKETESFIAGVLSKVNEMTAFLNPLPISYDRLGEHEAPKYISWSYDNRSQLIRIPAATGEKMRMELRSPDPTINPYLAFALVLHAGILGIENNLTLPESINVDLYSADKNITDQLTALPDNLGDALKIAKESKFIKDTLPPELYAKYFALKEDEYSDYAKAMDKKSYFMECYFKEI